MNPRIPILLASLAVTSASWAAEGLFVDSHTVRQVQQTLADRGYRSGGADGRMGPQTQAALRNFQRAEKLEPSGQLNHQTLVALGIQKEEAGDGMTLGYDRAVIRRAQKTLNNRGFGAGPENGQLTERTRAAIREFQRSENLADSGRLNSRTLAALGVSEDATLAAAERDPRVPPEALVQDVQRALARSGYAVGRPDGVLGPATRAALSEFQRSQQLPATGRLDRETLGALKLEDLLARQ